MINFEAIKDIIWQFATDFLKVDVVRADQAGARTATRPYLTFKILNGPSSFGTEDERIISSDSENLVLSNEGQRDLIISFNSYGTGAGELMSFLQSILRSNSGREKLNFLAREKEISLAFIDAPTMQDLTSLIQSDYEERFQMDATFRTTSKFVEKVPFVETVIVGVDKAEADAGKPAIRNQAEKAIAPKKDTIN